MAGIDRAVTAVSSAEPLLAEAMRLKDDDEIALLREAANLADVAYTATVDRLHPELRAYEIVRNVDRSVRGAGGGGWWSPAESELDLTGMPAFPRGAVVGLLDRRPETGVLDAGAPLPFHLHPLARCYTGASGTTVVFRPPGPALRSAAGRLAEALDAAIGAVSPGARGDEVHRAFSRVAGGSGESEGLSLLGYAVGTGPGPVVVSERAGGDLEPRMAFCLRATARTGPARPAVVYQTTVLVTETGAERLDVVVPLRLVELH
jgi:Xaa-Pro aminopeptidase